VNVTVTDISETRKDLIITISGEEIAKEEQQVLSEFCREARVPGFRPGKAPADLVRRRYRKELKEEVERKVVGLIQKDAFPQSELNIHSIISFPEELNLVAGQDANIDITVDVFPKYELPDYSAIEVKLPPVEVSDEEVEEAILNIRRQRADFQVVERPAAASDYVKVSYSGTVDGQPVADLVGDAANARAWANVENGWEEAGTEEARQFGVPAIIDALVGMAAGDTKEVEAVCGDDCPVEALRGKTVLYSVTAHEVRERKIPELDEEFVKGFKAESVEEFKANVLDDLEARKQRARARAQREQILAYLADAVDFALPETAVENETQNVMGRIMVENMRRGVPESEFEKNKESLHAESQGIARRDVKLQNILTRIAEQEKIEITEQDMQQAILGMARQMRQSPDEVVRELRRHPERIFALRRQILVTKALDLLVGRSKVSDQAS